jgi:hypothetical protein
VCRFVVHIFCDVKLIRNLLALFARAFPREGSSPGKYLAGAIARTLERTNPPLLPADTHRL